MKSVTLLTFFIAASVFVFAQNPIPNPSFETWDPYGSGAITGELPRYWQTSDSAFQAFSAPHSAVKEGVEKCDSLFSLKLISVTNGLITGPGFATNGKVISLSSITGGSPDTLRSAKLTGCINYVPVNNDRAIIAALLFWRNTTTGNKDTIAWAFDTLGATGGMMTNYELEFNYEDWEHNPDTILIILQSSIAVGDPNAQAGSALYVDNLGLNGLVGVTEIGSPLNSVSLFPSPAKNELTVRIDYKEKVKTSFEILDVAGRQVRSGAIRQEEEKIDVSVLASGNYYLVLKDNSGKQLYSGNFAISR